MYGVRCDAEFLPGAPLLSVPQGESGAVVEKGLAPPSAAAAATMAEDTERVKNLLGVLGCPPLPVAWLLLEVFKAPRRLRKLSLGDA